MTKHWTRWLVVAPALALIASAALACGSDAAAESQDPKDAKVVADKGTKGCDMPCCARAKDGAEAKTSATAAKKGHAKKKADAVAPSAPATAKSAPESAQPVPASSGTQR